MKLTVFGADGGTGGYVVEQALAKGWQVTAMHHHVGDEKPVSDNHTIGEADVLSDDLSSFVEGRDAVISALGVGASPSTLMDPPPLYTKGTGRICDAMEANGTSRLVVVSASFVETGQRGPLHFRLPAMVALNAVFDQMGDMERALGQREAISWTAVRPGWLMDAPLTRDYVVTKDAIPEDLIRTRMADLAHFMVTCVEDEQWVRQTPAIARAEDQEATSLKATVEEFVSA